MDNQLLIIGNGFDLYCGLKSSYYDFYVSEIRDKYLTINTDYPENFWFYLLTKYESCSKDYNWCDIEKIVKDTLQAIFFKTQKPTQFENITPIFSTAFNLTMGIFFNDNSPNIDNIKIDYVDKFILKYCTCFYLSTNQQFALVRQDEPLWLEKTKNNFVDHLLVELKKLEKSFCEYIKKQALNNINYKLKARDLIFKIFGLDEFSYIGESSSLGISNNNFSSKKVLSFNYTYPFEECKNLTYANVHGKLCGNDCTSCASSSAIFGIDDLQIEKDQADNTKNEKAKMLRYFSKTYRTMFLDGERKNILPFCDNNNPLTIKFFGHSLAQADYSYFQSIFDYYNLYENKKLSLIFYYTPFKEGIKNITTDSVYNLINEYGLTLSNANQGKNLMHKLILEQRVKIVDITL